MTLETISPCGPCPSPRGYHSFTTFGDNYCIVIGGRTEEGRIQGGHMVAVYDASRNCWVPLPPIGPPTDPPPEVGGASVTAVNGGEASLPLPPPVARSSHRAVALKDRIVVHGGSANEKDSNRLSDVATLVLDLSRAASITSQIQICWSACDQPSTQVTPTGKGNHVFMWGYLSWLDARSMPSFQDLTS